MAEQIKDAVTGEELSAFTVTTADGRTIVVNARDEDSARAVAREQSGGIGILSVEEGAAEAESTDDDDDSMLTGDELYLRAQELDIEGRSTMTADELRAAIAEAE